VLGTAKLGALANVEAGLSRVNPHLVYAIGKQIGFARELRYPEAVHDIC